MQNLGSCYLSSRLVAATVWCGVLPWSSILVTYLSSFASQVVIFILLGIMDAIHGLMDTSTILKLRQLWISNRTLVPACFIEQMWASTTVVEKICVPSLVILFGTCSWFNSVGNLWLGGHKSLDRPWGISGVFKRKDDLQSDVNEWAWNESWVKHIQACSKGKQLLLI